MKILLAPLSLLSQAVICKEYQYDKMIFANTYNRHGARAPYVQEGSDFFEFIAD